MTEPLKSIQLTFCRLDIGEGWAATHFPDGTSYGAEPHYTDDYTALAERLGYLALAEGSPWPNQAARMQYCAEHEFCHSFIAQEIYGSASRVLWPLAHGRIGSPADICSEEALAIMFQQWLRAGIIMAATAPGVNWWELKAKALELLEG